jgi:single-strand DNA-binding protein
MNKVILSGNLCQDVEVKQTQNGKAVVTNCVAVQREYKSPNGEYESDFINIVVWGAQADYLGKYASKGDRVELCGRWMVRKYQVTDGSTRVANECVVESIKAFRKPSEQSNNTQYMPTEYTEIADNATGLPF